MKYHLLIPAVSILLLSGCGESRNSAPVSGTVTLDGKPMAEVIVRFQPIGAGDMNATKNKDAGMGSFGKTDSEGRFEMAFSDNERSGATIGENSVIIDEETPPEEANNDAGGVGEEEPSRIPARWRDGSQRFTVKDGDNTADFNLD